MKRNTKIVLAAALVAGLGTLAVAGTSYADKWRGMHEGYHGMSGGHHGGFGDGPGGGFGPGGHGGHGRGAMKFFMDFDADKNGELTQAEIDETRAQRLAKFDANGDGALTLQEYEALWLDAMRERMVDRFQDLDDDGDASVTLEEFKEPFAYMVTMMDRNGDGVLSRDDRPRRGEHRRDGDDDDRRPKGDND